MKTPSVSSDLRPVEQSTKRHTPGPWRVGAVTPTRFPSYPIVSKAGSVVAEVSIMAHGRSDHDARRIVACVNACSGIATERLVSDYTQGYEPWGDVEYLRADNARLREALHGAMFFVPLGTKARERADSALDSAALAHKGE